MLIPRNLGKIKREHLTGVLTYLADKTYQHLLCKLEILSANPQHTYIVVREAQVPVTQAQQPVEIGSLGCASHQPNTRFKEKSCLGIIKQRMIEWDFHTLKRSLSIPPFTYISHTETQTHTHRKKLGPCVFFIDNHSEKRE